MTFRSVPPSRDDERWMARAVALAEKGRCTVSPNPMVGSCIVRGGRLVSEGWHERYGADHAEVMALRLAKGRARGAVLYITLEPCSSWGKTPPCVEAVLAARPGRVVIGSADPNPENHGAGIRLLKKAGIRVTVGILAAAVEKQNAAFYKYTATGRPFVTLKMAQSLDGKIAATGGESRWISSPVSRRFVHRLRAEQDAVLVGKNTLLRDNPFLSPRVRLPLNPGKPWRVALDRSFSVRPGARIFSGDQVTLLAVSEKNIKKIASRKLPPGAGLLPVAEKRGQLDVRDLVAKLGALGAAKILVEGGGETAWSFLSAGCVDKILWIVAPTLMGGREAKTSVEGDGVKEPSAAIKLRNLQWSRLGPDLLCEAEL